MQLFVIDVAKRIDAANLQSQPNTVLASHIHTVSAPSSSIDGSTHMMTVSSIDIPNHNASMLCCLGDLTVKRY